jgi:hypothetical protein
MRYTASLLRKCAKIYKETCLTVENNLVLALKKHAMNPDLPEIEEIFPR